MSDDIVAMDLMSRVIRLEQRVTALEEKRAQSSVPSADSGRQPSGSSDAGGTATRRAAINALREQLERKGVSITGVDNRGKSALSVVDTQGRKHPIYLSASKNHITNEGRLGSWNTISPEDIGDDRFTAFILSTEEEHGSILFFIFTPAELRAIVACKTISGSLFHFYIGRGEEANTFLDYRDDQENTDTEKRLNLTPYFQAWTSLLTLSA